MSVSAADAKNKGNSHGGLHRPQVPVRKTMRSEVSRRHTLGARGAACLLVAACAAAVGTHGCSFVTNTTAVQCTTEAECLALGPDFVDTKCDPATKTCVKVDPGSDLCTTNQQCLTAASGLPAICRKSDHKCVTLTSTECPTVMGTSAQLLDDNTIVIGALRRQGTRSSAMSWRRRSSSGRRTSPNRRSRVCRPPAASRVHVRSSSLHATSSVRKATRRSCGRARTSPRTSASRSSSAPSTLPTARS